MRINIFKDGKPNRENREFQIISWILLALAFVFLCLSAYLSPLFLIITVQFGGAGLYFYLKTRKPAKTKTINTTFHTANSSSTRIPIVPPTPSKLSISASDLQFFNVIPRYLTDAHYKSPAQYDFYDYHRAEFDCLLQGLARVEIAPRNEKVLRNSPTLTPFEKSAPLTKRTSVKRICNFVAIDVETTGLKTSGNDIIEISAVKFENYIPISIFTTLLKPRKPIPPEASAVNGITDAMVENSPRFAQIKMALQNFIGGYSIVAHNAAFDIKFLFVSGLDFPENQVIFDTLELSRRHIKDLDNYRLATVCADSCIYFDGAHRASADALATGLLFLELIRIVREDNLA